MKIEIYTVSYCIYCNLAKELLKKANILYTEIELEKNEKLLNEMIYKYNHKTVPIIIIDGKLLGGYSELKEFLNKNNYNL